MKGIVGVVVASALAALPAVAHADKAADACLAGGRKLESKGRYADAITAWKAFCPVATDGPPCTKQLAKPVNGVADLTVPNADGSPTSSLFGELATLKLEAGGVKSQVLLERAERGVIGGYPSAAPVDP